MDLSELPYIDGHMHPPLRRPPATVEEYRWPWYEGGAGSTHMVTDLATYRAAMRELAEHLGCEESEQAVLDALGGRDPGERFAEMMRLGGVEGLIMDMGYPDPSEALSVEDARAMSGVDVRPLLRIESVAGGLVDGAGTFAEFAERFDAALRSARDDGYLGLKSIIAYRTGLAVEAIDEARAAEAFEQQRGIGARVAVKALLDHLLVRALGIARELGLPMQLHTGYGDRDLDLALGNPLHLRGLLESGSADGVPLVLLHGSWPYTREAAYLAAVHEHVYVDIATCIPPLGFGEMVSMWRIALAAAPVTRIQASTDAAGVPEQVGLGARWSRRSLAVALEELVGADMLRAGEAEDAAAAILAGNARQLYV
ncbi:MAG TPA: amidohydrolase family protein [Gaiellales bacterium]|nr:amidohydrolase family protein [Gaiellales bacterium]